MKRAIGLIAAAALALGFCGCGKKEAAHTAAERAETGPAILIGCVAPKTGEAATFGISCENGVRLAIEQANAAGGLFGRPLELIVEDDKGDPVAGKIAFSRLIERERVCAVVGAVMSKVSLAGAEVAEASRTPMISSSSTSQFVTLGKRYVFRACFTDPFQGYADAHIAWDTLKARRAAVLYDSANDYNKGLAEIFKRVFTQLGGEVVAYESYPERSNDFKPQLTKILPAAPDVLFLPNYYNDVALQVSQAREIGIKAAFLGGDGWDSPELLKVAAAEGGYFSNHFSRESDSPLREGVRRRVSAALRRRPRRAGLARLRGDGDPPRRHPPRRQRRPERYPRRAREDRPRNHHQPHHLRQGPQPHQARRDPGDSRTGGRCSRAG